MISALLLGQYASCLVPEFDRSGILMLSARGTLPPR